MRLSHPTLLDCIAHVYDLLSPSQCVQETCNFDAIFSYLTCGNYDFRYDMQSKKRDDHTITPSKPRITLTRLLDSCHLQRVSARAARSETPWLTKLCSTPSVQNGTC